MVNREYLKDRFNQAAGILPQMLRNDYLKLSDEEKMTAEEFRLRAGRSATVLLNGAEKQIARNITQSDLLSIVEIATEASIHTTKESLKSGYITASGGHRIGICGTAVVKNGEVTGFRSISSLAVRISKEIIGVADELFGGLLENGQLCSTMIISPPGGGKTTLLRDIIRIISKGGKRISVADERGEIAALKGGVPQYDIGDCADVLDFCPRAEAVIFLLRAMNPQVIAMDEITDKADYEALLNAMGCGVTLLATAHSGSFNDLQKRKLYREMLSSGLFERLVVIENKSGIRTYRIERCD